MSFDEYHRWREPPDKLDSEPEGGGDEEGSQLVAEEQVHDA
jgi:hypothetical protein